MSRWLHGESKTWHMEVLPALPQHCHLSEKELIWPLVIQQMTLLGIYIYFFFDVLLAYIKIYNVK